MEELLRKQFEAQFGDEWSQPVVNSAHKGDGAAGDEAAGSGSDSGSGSGSDAGSGDESEQELDGASDSESGPKVVKHQEISSRSSQTKHRRQFMSSTAPREPVVQPVKKTKEDEDNLEDDLALQRLIEESHILDSQRQFSGADISFGDPMEQVGKARLAIMQARLEKAGAKRKQDNIPIHIAKGMKAKQQDRSSKRKEYAKDAGIVLAKEKKVRKQRVHDKGLKINSVGKETAHGIVLSEREISRGTSSKRGKGGKRGRR